MIRLPRVLSVLLGFAIAMATGGVFAAAASCGPSPHPRSPQWPSEARHRRAAGSHGRSGLAKMVLGSVAAKVLALSPVPVMILK